MNAPIDASFRCDGAAMPNTGCDPFRVEYPHGGPMLNAATPLGSNATINSAALHLTPEGSQLVEQERPHATTTPEGSQPEFRVSDRSGTPQGCNQPEEYSGERDPEALRGDTPKKTTRT